MQLLTLVFFHLGFSTFLGVIVIAFSESKLFQLLFRILFSIVILGLVHGLVFLPVLLSLFCPWKLNFVVDENNHSLVNDSELDSGEENGDELSYKYDYYLDSKCPCDFCNRF